MAEQKEYKVGIYVRLSKEDTRQGESVSIENQKLMLTKYVKEAGWVLKEIYQDDGFSGTNQNRPAFQRMLADVKAGHINTLLIKDLSRLGRNYLEVGNLAEVFLPEHGCQLISLNEKLDDMMVFRNWFNEQHSKSTSMKVRASRRICAENGKYLGAYAPYGFKKDPNHRHRLIIDQQTAPVVRRIFEMRASGMGFRAIAARLNEERILPPRGHYYQEINKKNPCKTHGLWSENSVKDMLKNEVYIGNLVQGKVGTQSYKNHKLVPKPKQEWIRAEATHQPLIERALWDRVQAFGQKGCRSRRRRDGKTNLFTGLLYCADCGFKLRGQMDRRKRKDGSEYKAVFYICGTYAHSGKHACSIHSISENALIGLVMEPIRVSALRAWDAQSMIEAVLSVQRNETLSCHAACQQELAAHKKQIARLDLLLDSLYEDRATGLVPESLFKRQIQRYEKDRAYRLQLVELLEKRMKGSTQTIDAAAALKGLREGYTRAEGLDGETLLLLIDKILVGEAQSIDGKRVCDVTIHYNCTAPQNQLEVKAEGGAAPVI